MKRRTKKLVQRGRRRARFGLTRRTLWAPELLESRSMLTAVAVLPALALTGSMSPRVVDAALASMATERAGQLALARDAALLEI